MAKFDVPWALNGPRRIPTADEIATGYPCGPADRELFNHMGFAVWEELGNIVKNSGFNGSWDDGHTVTKAIQSGGINYAVTSGTANSLTVTLNPSPVVYPALVTVKFTATNTDAATIRINDLPPVNIVRLTGAPLQYGDLSAGGVGILAFDGAQYQVISIPVAAGKIITHQNPGTYIFIVPEGVTKIRHLRIWGAGGGGGGSLGAAGAGSGGGGGAYGEKVDIAVTPGDEIVVTVGAGGIYGIAQDPPTHGTAGGASSFGPHLTVAGGGGGSPGANGYSVNTPPGGTSPANADIGMPGQGGGSGWIVGGNIPSGGLGGAAPFGGGNPGVSTGTRGINGIWPGGGGNGGAYGKSGGTGANGLVIIEI